MKRIITLIVTLAAFVAAESTADAQLLKNLINKTTSTELNETLSDGTLSGKAAGAALRSLYVQYKKDGKLDMANLNNIVNITTLATNIQGLKGKSDKMAFYKDFAAGLILGSENLVNEKNSSSVMTGLQNIVNNVDLTAFTKQAEDKAASAVSSIKGKINDASGKADTAMGKASEVADALSDILNVFK